MRYLCFNFVWWPRWKTMGHWSWYRRFSMWGLSFRFFWFGLEINNNHVWTLKEMR